jgi:RNA polymerase sigma factor for flagellar operon FliA
VAVVTITEEKSRELFLRYKQTKDTKVRNDIVMAYSSVVKYAVISTRNMYQKYADAEDITNEGMMALISAVESFDTEKNVKFETYASIKIRGAIIDYIRKQDVIPRGVRRFAKDLDATFSKLYVEFGREPTNEELAKAMGISVEKLQKGMAAAASANSLSFEEMIENGAADFSAPKDEMGNWETERNLYLKERSQMLARAIDKLNEQQKTVVSLYYYEQLRFSDIAEVMGVSESRVCQIHTKAMMLLRISMEDYIKQ